MRISAFEAIILISLFLLLILITAICVEECPTVTDYKRFICMDAAQMSANLTVSVGYSFVNNGLCMYQVSTKAYANLCYLNGISAQETVKDATYIAASNGITLQDTRAYSVRQSANYSFYNSFFRDLYFLKTYIGVFGLLIPFILAVLFVSFFLDSSTMTAAIWSTNCATAIFLAIGSWQVFITAQIWQQDGVHSNGDVAATSAAAIVGIVLIFCQFSFMWSNRVVLGEAQLLVLSNAIKPLYKMPSIITIPLALVAAQVVFLIVWGIFNVHLAAAGSDVMYAENMNINSASNEQVTYQTFSFHKSLKYSSIFMIFAFVWTSEFIVCLGEMMTIIAVSTQYFNVLESEGTVFGKVYSALPVAFLEEYDNFVFVIVYQSIATTWQFCLGKAAFASLITMTTRLLRWPLRLLLAVVTNSPLRERAHVMTTVESCHILVQCFHRKTYIFSLLYLYDLFDASKRVEELLLTQSSDSVNSLRKLSAFVIQSGKVENDSFKFYRPEM